MDMFGKVSIHRKIYQLDPHRKVEMGLDPEQDCSPYLDISRQDGTGVRFTSYAIQKLLGSVSTPSNWITEMDQMQDGLEHLTWTRSLDESYKLHDHPGERLCGGSANTPRWAVSISDLEGGTSIKVSQDAWKKFATLEPLLSLHYDMLSEVQYAEKTLLDFFLSKIVYAGRKYIIAEENKEIMELADEVYDEMSKDLNNKQKCSLLEVVFHHKNFITHVVNPRLFDDDEWH